MNDQELHDLIARAAPADAATIATFAIDDAATELFDRIISTPALRGVAERPHRRRRLLLVVAAAIAALALAGAGWAGLKARTGFFSSGGEGGTGEYIRLDAPDAEPIVDELARDIPLPPGQSFDSWKANVLGPRAGTHGVGVVMSESGIRASLEYTAACEWTGYWLDGFERGDEQQMADGLRVLEEIPTWPATVASDGGGLVDSYRLRALGARQHNPSLFLRDYLLNCAH